MIPVRNPPERLNICPTSYYTRPSNQTVYRTSFQCCNSSRLSCPFLNWAHSLSAPSSVIKLVWTRFLIYLSLPIKTLYPFLLSLLFLLYPAQYFATTMVIVGLSVIATVLVLQYHHHDPDGDKMPKWVSIISLYTIICELYCNPLNIT